MKHSTHDKIPKRALLYQGLFLLKNEKEGKKLLSFVLKNKIRMLEQNEIIALVRRE